MGTTPGPAGSPMGESDALCCSHKLIHLYRAFGRQLTCSPSTNYAELSISHHQSQNLLPSTLSGGWPVVPHWGWKPGRDGCLGTGTAAPLAHLYLGKARLHWEELGDLLCSWTEVSHTHRPAKFLQQTSAGTLCYKPCARRII